MALLKVTWLIEALFTFWFFLLEVVEKQTLQSQAGLLEI